MKTSTLIVLIIIVIVVIFAVWQIEGCRYVGLKNSDIIQLDYNHQFVKLKYESQERVVVSMSTIPDRIEHLGPTLASILTQNVHVNEIAINIPYKSRKGLEYEIPTWLEKLHNVKIYRVEKDLGPATKILPTLQREAPSTRIIAIDDDVIYHSNTVKALVNTFDKYDGQHAITNFGIKLQPTGELPTTSSRILSFFNKSQEVDLLQGFSAFIVAPKLFPKEVFDLNNGPSEAISVDDIWLSGWLRFNGVKIMSAGSTYRQLPLVNLGKMRATTALGKGENKGFTRDQIVIRWFMEEKGVQPVSH